MPSEEWKIRNFKQKWYAGETISVGIGQGAVAATPVQLAYVVVNVEGHLAVFGAGRHQEILGVELPLELFQHRTTLGDGLDEEISRARKRLIDRGRTEGDANVDHRAKVEAERFEMLEEQAKVAHRRVRSQQSKAENLQDAIDALENG